MWILTFSQSPCLYFWFFISGLTESCSSFEDLSAYKFSWSHVDWCKFCIHLSSLNIHHFGNVKAVGLKLWCWDHLQWHDLPTKFHKNLLTGSKFVGGGRQESDLIGLLFPFGKENRLRKICPSKPYNMIQKLSDKTTLAEHYCTLCFVMPAGSFLLVAFPGH
jgi:hypothetical protein